MKSTKKKCGVLLLKLISIMIVITIIMNFNFVFAIDASAATNSPSRVINIVYDDSGSMIETDGVKVDTWCQAKYAMEVFAAMLGQNDTMNVYVMSDFVSNTTAGPKVVLDGKEGAKANVAKIHEMLTKATDTPFNSVRKAYSDLTKVKADEKWLVVLTDGEFQGIGGTSAIDAFFAKKQDAIKVMFLSMGPKADKITENVSENIFTEEAKSNDQILNKITSICTRIFNSHRLDVNVTSKTFSFDVPMGELVVFAQGANVSINGIKNSEGKLFKSSKTPVSVKFSEKAATNFDDVLIAENLVGSIATFNEDFVTGTYTVDVTGAETIEIYYKPNVEIAAYLTDSKGNEVTDLSDLEAGDYTINFGFVKGGTKEKVEQSELLGDVSYIAEVTNNGKKHSQNYSSGSKITLEEGSLSINVVAHYLDYNTVSTLMEYTVFKNKKITFSVQENPTFIVNKEGFAEQKCIVLKATIDGKDFTNEQWGLVGIPVVKFLEEQDFEMGPFKVEKGEEAGIYYVYPSFSEKGPTSGIYQNCQLTVEIDEHQGIESWKGYEMITLNLQDNRSWFEQNKELIIRLIVLGIILFLVLGYMPFIKHYLPRKLKANPKIDVRMRKPGVPPLPTTGTYRKFLFTTLIPYIPESGRVDFVPGSVSGVPALEIKGAGKKMFIIKNFADYAGNNNVTFNGSSIKKDTKKFAPKSAGLVCSVTHDGRVYTCKLNKD